MRVPFVDLYAQYLTIKDAVDVAIASVISDAAFIKGKYVERFEEEFSNYCGRRYCIGCANGTDALEIALRALEIGAGHEVLVPANTWISTAEAVTTAGAKVVFVDSHPDSYTIDVSKIEAKISKKTRAIIPVHLYGLPAEMDAITEIARRHQLLIIEDCAQSHGSTFRGKKAGTFGVIATYSFFPGKNLGAYGDAGAITTDDETLAKRCRMISDHGRIGKFDHALEGRNSRLDGLQAAILSAKLPYLEEWTELRRSHAELYSRLLENAGLKLPSVPPYSRHVYHLYVVQVANRPEVQARLEELGVSTGVHYPIALPMLKAYEYMKHYPQDFPIASGQMSKILSLPMYAELKDEQIEFVVESLLSIGCRAAA